VPKSRVRTLTGTTRRSPRASRTGPVRTAATVAARSAARYVALKRFCGYALRVSSSTSAHIARRSPLAHAAANFCATVLRASSWRLPSTTYATAAPAAARASTAMSGARNRRGPRRRRLRLPGSSHIALRP
jgi:hypothetical protein